jgi:hypothetical protein
MNDVSSTHDISAAVDGTEHCAFVSIAHNAVKSAVKALPTL